MGWNHQLELLLMDLFFSPHFQKCQGGRHDHSSATRGWLSGWCVYSSVCAGLGIRNAGKVANLAKGSRSDHSTRGPSFFGFQSLELRQEQFVWSHCQEFNILRYLIQCEILSWTVIFFSQQVWSNSDQGSNNANGGVQSLRNVPTHPLSVGCVQKMVPKDDQTFQQQSNM